MNIRFPPIIKHLHTMTAKEIAMLDMKASGVEVKFLLNEKAILQFTATDLSVRVDFRKFNGGYHPKKKSE